MPETTRTTAMIHSKVAMKASLQGAHDRAHSSVPRDPLWDLSDDWAAGAARLALLPRVYPGANITKGHEGRGVDARRLEPGNAFAASEPSGGC